ncbi:MAG: hypothetical protein JSW39_28680 [Desulfobacterales bacterium]|nr:MAG: hypothetical protein JSW39_28680 [Desulfobacterales bacterium]
MKRKLSAYCGAVILILGLVGFAHALPYEFDMGKSWVDISGTSDVLQMYAEVNPNLQNVTFTLSAGQSSGDIFFATFGTTETWINDDDVIPGNVRAYVDFDDPNLTQAVGGTSVGFAGSFEYTQGWSLIWNNDPVFVDFGDGGRFSIALSDVGYQSWWWQGPDGKADVYARITLISEPGSGQSVPDASIMLLLGPSLIVLGLFSRREFKQ